MRFIVLFFALLPLTTLNSQTRKFQIGVQVQTAMSDLLFRYEGNPAVEEFFNESATWRFAPGAAVLGRYRCSSKLLVQTSLGYSLSGYQVKAFDLYLTTPDQPEGVYLGKTRGVVHYHDVSLGIHGKAALLPSVPAFYILGGVANLFKLGRSQTIISRYETGQTVKTKGKLPQAGRTLSPWVLRADLGFGFKHKVFGHAEAFIEPFGGFTFLPIIKEGDGKYKQFTTGLNLGLAW